MNPDQHSPEFQDACLEASHRVTALFSELLSLPGQDTRTALAGLLGAVAGIVIAFKPEGMEPEVALAKTADNIEFYGRQFIHEGLSESIEALAKAERQGFN